MNYGETIREIRLSKALTQKEVAGNIVSLSFYAKVEKGENNLSADKFFKILNKLNIEIDEFLFVHNDFKENPKKNDSKADSSIPR
ncbi:helix-turn-helix domain-containing protein [Listeria cornellensis]|uniref:TetR family transcriptional regulator n=1 Tax=Listeria cornellensis FSL F6-0969 TaxID=1265820 RepID=W7BGZ3_9LIST|nr:helix-turn-helix transcriptional regulator [Listeria cornellensis]EUJ26329.1 TetR family transcriptional regulator [Listeria cornellensis FSL F6-0969]